MKLRLMLFSISLIATSALAHDPFSGTPVPPATNKDGSVVTGVLTARFDTTLGLEGLPVPNNLYFQGTTDLTISAPLDGLDGTAAALVSQINALDGFSTIERWTMTFVDDDGNPGSIDASTVVPGQTVRVFQVSVDQIVAVTGIVRELTPGVDYVTAVSGNAVAIVPLQPLPEYSSFMAVMTNDITDAAGNNATPDQQYFLAKSLDPWVDENGNSTYPLLDDGTAASLEGLRQITLSQEFTAAAAGINRDDIIISWTVQTQAITPVLKLLRSVTQGSPVALAPTGLTTAVAGGFGLADIYIGVITVPYYLGAPSAENPIAPLTDYWQAEPGAYIPPFDAFGLDPTSTNLTLFNPFPVVQSVQTVPIMVTVPNANSGWSKPATGWPTVIYGHGLGSNRASVLAAADGLAQAGHVAVAMDFPLHGVMAEVDPLFGAFDIENTPFGAIADERTFRVDYQSNETGLPGPDGVPDFSGSHALNFQNFLVSRDNVRQGIADLMVLANSIQNFDLDSDGLADLQPYDLGYTGISWGAINGTGFSALEPFVTRSFLSVPGGGLVRGGEASQAFGPRIRAGLASAGIFPGDPLFELYLTVGQTAADAADPINWIREATTAKPVALHEVIGDTVIPNYVATAPLSGTEPMIRVGGLTPYSSTQADPAGLRVAGRFPPPATHGSLLSPASSPEATVEMQGQMGSFLASGGKLINVTNAATMVPVVTVDQLVIGEPSEGDKSKKPGKGTDPRNQLETRRTKNGDE